MSEVQTYSGPIQPPKDYRIMGFTRMGLSMKDLYFLHHRDPVHEEQLSIAAGGGSRPLSWETIRSILLYDSVSQNPLLTAAYYHHRRVNDVQLDTIAEAMEVLTREGITSRGYEGKTEEAGGKPVQPTIYHLLWRCHSWNMDEKYLFRGQSDSRWRQDSSIYRGHLRYEGHNAIHTPPDLREILKRLCRTQTFLDKLQTTRFRHLPDENKLAIAQHYGMPTPLLDYTRSLDVAAFFATGAGDQNRIFANDIGVIYIVDRKPLMRPEVPEGAIDIIESSGLRIGDIDSIDFSEVLERVGRIERQKGVFIEGFDSYLLQRLTTKVLYFRQTETFQDTMKGIDGRTLMDNDQELEDIAAQCQNSTNTINPGTMCELLGRVKLPGDDFFGSKGLYLGQNLRKAQYVLSEIQECENIVGTDFVRALAEVLSRHFSEARITARTSGAAVSSVQHISKTDLKSSEDVYRMKPSDVQPALLELAKLAHMEPSEFEEVIAPHRPKYVDFKYQDFDYRGDKRQALAVAAAIFVIGLEHMRTAGGAEAHRLFSGVEATLFHIQR
ncbi:hypothetical protein AnigIFM63604_006031 [Aspergillus niger]|uniref:FRG domain-containing protein n=1 Tax=Aspergillus niger TaxID=5061 RepID=A0A9W5ZYJ7_ASPNG|nr:hypothetical protein AnigIFM63604_006031 [Aspergillus niger]